MLIARADLRALRVGRPPTWASYRVGLRLLQLVEAVRDTLTPPDLRALGGPSARHLPGYYGMVKRLDEALGRLVAGQGPVQWRVHQHSHAAQGAAEAPLRPERRERAARMMNTSTRMIAVNSDIPRMTWVAMPAFKAGSPTGP